MGGLPALRLGRTAHRPRRHHHPPALPALTGLAVRAAVRDRRDGLLHGVVARQPVGQARDPQRLGVPVPGPGQGQDPVPRGELLPVPDDDGQRAGVHEVDGGEVKDDAVGLTARRGQVLVELAAGHRVELAADRHDRDLAVTVRRQSEPLHHHSPRTASTQSNRTRPIVCANDVSWPPRIGTPPRGISGTVDDGETPHRAPGASAGRPGSAGRDGLSHLAFLYRGAGEYLEQVLAFVAGGLARSEPVFAALPAGLAWQVRADLKAAGWQLAVADMSQLGRNPARITLALTSFAG